MAHMTDTAVGRPMGMVAVVGRQVGSDMGPFANLASLAEYCTHRTAPYSSQA